MECAHETGGKVHSVARRKVMSSRADEWHMSQVCHPYDLASRLCMQRVVQYVAVARLLNV